MSFSWTRTALLRGPDHTTATVYRGSTPRRGILKENKMTTFHVSNLGSFGSNLPNKGGFVTYSVAEYDRAVAGLRAGQAMPSGLKGARRNAWLVRQAERQINAWRAQS